ncbi:MAG: zinc-binding dehydrogenase [Gammaproteobacteria bacterium]|nr:zinc-binding dehydrogenase [Gammaproteobacteria bacterium]
MKGQIAVMTEPGKLTYQEYTVPDPEPGAIIARILRSNVCGTEVHIWCGHHPAKRSGGLGHETVAVVEKLGAGVTHDFAGQPIKEGDRIVSTYFIHCRRCYPCQKGQFYLCDNAYRFWGLQPEVDPHFHATFATHWYIHPEQMFYKVPDNVSDQAAASANCAQSQVYFGLDLSGITYGDSLVIQGAGGLGLNAAAIAHEKGAEVIMVDAVPLRLEEAKKFGAHHTISMADHPTVEARVEAVNKLTGGRGADYVMEVAGVLEAFPEGMKMVRAGGKMISMGTVTPGKTIPYDPAYSVRRGITTVTALRYNGPYLKKSMDFLSANKGKYPFDALLDKDFEMDSIVDALDESAARKVKRASIVMPK